MIIRLFFLYMFVLQWQMKQIHSETVSGCTRNNNDDNQLFASSNKTSVTLSCPNNEYILVRNLTFGVHKTITRKSTCTYQPGDCTIRTTYIGMECNGLRNCKLDLNPQYLHICSQYSDYIVLDYTCLQGQSLSMCDNNLILTSSINRKHRLFIRSPNYPNEYDNSLNCSCKINTNKANIEFLDFYLEERDEVDLCSRDYLKIANRSYCGSKVDQLMSSTVFNSSIYLTFKTNDAITRKGFWLMIRSEQAIRVSCGNSFELSFPSLLSLKPRVHSTPLSSTSLIMMTDSSRLPSTRRFTLSFILLLIIIFVIILLILNLILIIVCWKQRRSKESINSKTSSTTHRPFFCPKRSSTSSCSSITYGETPMFTSLDGQKRQTTSTTITTGTYDDPNELLTLQKQQKFDYNQSYSLQHRHEPKKFCPIVLPSCSANTAYNRMIHYPPSSNHCHLNSSTQTFYPLSHSHNPFDSQHIYETIQDGHCPYQRLAATIRRQQQQQQQQPKCTCYCTHNEHKTSTIKDDNDKNIVTEWNPETLV